MAKNKPKTNGVMMKDVSTTVEKPPMAYEELRDVIELSLWAGQLLLQHGAESQRVEETVHRLGTGLGCDWMDVLVSPNVLIVSTTSHHEFRTKVRRMVRLGNNFWIITAVNRLSRRVTNGELDRFQVRSELERIDKTPVQYPAWFILVMIGLACAAFSRLFGGSWPAVGITFVASSVAMWVRRQLTARYFNFYLVIVATAFVATMLSYTAVWWQIASAETAVVAAVLLLVPGVQLINAAEDLIKAHTVMGVIRGFNGLLISLGIALGLSLALRLWGASFVTPTPSTTLSLLEDAFWAGVATVGFAILFNVPIRTLWGCTVVAAVAHALRAWLMRRGINIELATLLASALIGFLGEVLARQYRTPTAVYTVAAVIPMIPGTFAFRTMISILQVTVLGGASNASAVLVEAAINGLTTGLILAAIGVGIALPGLLFKRQAPVV